MARHVSGGWRSAWLLLGLPICIASCGTPQGVTRSVPAPASVSSAPSKPNPQPDGWRAKLSFDGKRWRVGYTCPEAQKALLFDTAHGVDYRSAAWKPAAASTRVEHLDGLDALLFDQPTTTAELELEPSKRATDGTLAVVPFSDGTHALWTGQFALLTVNSVEEARALRGDLRNWRGKQPKVEVEVSSDVALIGPGGVGKKFASTAHQGKGAYFYTGTSDDPSLVVDPGLPPWVSAAFRTRMPEVRRTIEAVWQHDLPQPQLMLAWGGAEGKWTNRGRADGRQIVMHIQGAEYLERKDGLLEDLVWFFAHEMTHLQQFVDDGEGEPWMVEGFADTLATEVLVKIGMWDRAALERRYWSVARECARELSRGPLAEARGRAAYVCGDLVGVALLAQLPDGGLAELWKRARTSQARVDKKQLLEAARALRVGDAQLRAIETFVATRHDDTDAAIRSLLEAAGLKPKYVKGSLSSMAFPFRGPASSTAEPPRPTRPGP